MIRCRTQDQAHNEKRLTFKTKSMVSWSLRLQPKWLTQTRARAGTQDHVTDSRGQTNK